MNSTKYNCRTYRPKQADANHPKFVKMANMLRDEAVVLDAELRLQERTLRNRLISGFESFAESRKVLGVCLFDYRELYKPGRVWLRIFDRLVVLSGYSRRTLYRILEEHEIANGLRAAKHVPEEDAEAYEETSLGGYPLSSEQEDFLVARSLLREAIGAHRGNRLKEILEQLISFEAYDSWGCEKSFVLRIRPRRSTLVVSQSDGGWPHCEGVSDDFDGDASCVPAGFHADIVFASPSVTAELIQ